MRKAISFVFGQTSEGFCPETKADHSVSHDHDDYDDDSKMEAFHALDAAMTSLLELHIKGASENTDSERSKEDEIEEKPQEKRNR